MLGDFNVRVGVNHEPWPCNICYFGVGKLNEYGQRLLELCSYYDLCITNIFFITKPQAQDSILEAPPIPTLAPNGPRHHPKTIIDTVHLSLAATCDMDHSLVGSKLRLHPKQIHRLKQRGRPRINIAMTSIPVLCE